MSRTSLRLAVVCGCLVALAAGATVWAQAPKPEPPVQWVDTPTGRWMVHDEARPAPPVVVPGVCGVQEAPAPPPADAVVLFDGKDLSSWADVKGQPSRWVVRDGYMESVKGAGYVRTRQEFGSVQLHVEFATPSAVSGAGQGRGNSGVFLQGKYEVQVLDSYENKTYPDGQCGALYGRAVPQPGPIPQRLGPGTEGLRRSSALATTWPAGRAPPGRGGTSGGGAATPRPSRASGSPAPPSSTRRIQDAG
ncbi:MAG: hypothetical protein H6Q10_697 [Acidobacteria bacterium]|nr:hypothetical protein [Acidobacteriota bacterium]